MCASRLAGRRGGRACRVPAGQTGGRAHTQAPLAAGPPPLAVSRQAAAGRPIALTGAAPPRLANTAHVGAPEEAGEEAPPHVLLAAAALAAATASAPGGEGTAWQRMVAVVKLPVFVCLWRPRPRKAA